MSKGLSGPTWALLSPSSLPDASGRTILGSIIPDYEHPMQNTIPDDASKIMPEDWLAEPTEDENFKVAMTKATSRNARARLGNIVKLHFNKDKTNELDLTSISVKTFALNQPDKIFKLLKKDYKDDILEMINNAPNRNKGAVFQIVALKTCKDAQISFKGSEAKSRSADIKLPVNEIATAAVHGVPPPINPDVEGNIESTETATRDGSQVAKGERIFAVQYRLVKKRSTWPRLFQAKLPDDFEGGDYFVPRTEAMFEGDEDAEEEEEEEEEEDEDPLELGDFEHTWGLGGSEVDGIVMTRF
jgi:hypothetical protein